MFPVRVSRVIDEAEELMDVSPGEGFDAGLRGEFFGEGDRGGFQALEFVVFVVVFPG